MSKAGHLPTFIQSGRRRGQMSKTGRSQTFVQNQGARLQIFSRNGEQVSPSQEFSGQRCSAAPSDPAPCPALCKRFRRSTPIWPEDRIGPRTFVPVDFWLGHLSVVSRRSVIWRTIPFGVRCVTNAACHLNWNQIVGCLVGGTRCPVSSGMTKNGTRCPVCRGMRHKCRLPPELESVCRMSC